jgi:protoporphyrinogen oxidase
VRVGIIGAGAAGLAAAYDLTNAGHHVAVFEGAPFLGGQASTFPVNGTPLERGYHHLFRSDTAMAALMEELGLGERLGWFDSKVGYFAQGRLWPFTTPAHLLRFGPLPPLDRIRAGLMTLALQRRREWHSLESQTALEWVRRVGGRRVAEVIFEPMLRGKFGRHYDKVTMSWLWNKFALRTASRGKGVRGMAREQLGYPMGSFGEVFDVLAQRIRERGGAISLSTPVRRVLAQEGRATGLEVGAPGAEPATHDFDAVLATVPSFVLPRIAPPLPQGYLDQLAAQTYLAAVLVVLELDRPLTPFYWTYVGDRALPFLGVIEHTNMLPPDLYGGAHVVYLTNYLETDDPLYRMSAEELFNAYLPHLRTLNPAFEPSWVTRYHHHRVDAAQPVVTRGYAERMPGHRTPVPGLYLANTTQIYPEDRGTNYSVRMGRQVARLIMDDARR